MKSYKGLMGNIPYPGHKCSDGTSPFYKAENKWKTNLVREDLQPQKRKTMERVRSLVRSYRRLTSRMISSELNLSRLTVHQILTQDLDMRRVCAKMVPKDLTTEQKANRRDVCLDFLDRLDREPEFFSPLSQVMNHGFWSTTLKQNAKLGSGTLQTLPVPRKREWVNPKSNRFSFVFLTVRGSSTRNLYHQDKLSIKLFIWKPLKDSEKCWHVCDQALHELGCCTTTTPHVTRQSPSMNFWQKKAFMWFLRPPYSPDLSACDFFLFPRLKNHLKGRHFGTLDNIQKSVTDELKGIPAKPSSTATNNGNNASVAV